MLPSNTEVLKNKIKNLASHNRLSNLGFAQNRIKTQPNDTTKHDDSDKGSRPSSRPAQRSTISDNDG